MQGVVKQFPHAHFSDAEREFIVHLCDARSRCVGYGWMRQMIGIAWRLSDPIGYIDDDRIRELYAPKKRKRRIKKRAKR